MEIINKQQCLFESSCSAQDVWTWRTKTAAWEFGTARSATAYSCLCIWWGEGFFLCAPPISIWSPSTARSLRGCAWESGIQIGACMYTPTPPLTRARAHAHTRTHRVTPANNPCISERRIKETLAKFFKGVFHSFLKALSGQLCFFLPGQRSLPGGVLRRASGQGFLPLPAELEWSALLGVFGQSVCILLHLPGSPQSFWVLVVAFCLSQGYSDFCFVLFQWYLGRE